MSGLEKTFVRQSALIETLSDRWEAASDEDEAQIEAILALSNH
jgi:hypothetical protein